jgi:hypothetical protein
MQAKRIVCVNNFTPQYLPTYRVPLPYDGMLRPLGSDEEALRWFGKGFMVPISSCAQIENATKGFRPGIALLPACSSG